MISFNWEERLYQMKIWNYFSTSLIGMTNSFVGENNFPRCWGQHIRSIESLCCKTHTHKSSQLCSWVNLSVHCWTYKSHANEDLYNQRASVLRWCCLRSLRHEWICCKADADGRSAMGHHRRYLWRVRHDRCWRVHQLCYRRWITQRRRDCYSCLVSGIDLGVLTHPCK